MVSTFLSPSMLIRVDASGVPAPRTVGFEAQAVVEAITLQSLELPNPIDNAATDRGPIVYVHLFLFRCIVRRAHYIFAMAVPNAVFGQQLIASWIGGLSDDGGVARIPVQHQVLGWNRFQHGSRFFARGSVAGHFVFEQQNEIVFGAAFGSLLQFGIDCRPVRLLIIKPPVVETANPVGVESFGERDAARVVCPALLHRSLRGTGRAFRSEATAEPRASRS